MERLPDGLKGSDIPIGARILSVVDCFDALTSDRPYRPRLADTEALRVLMERRGTMYDPLIVDTFVHVYKDIAPPEEHPEASSSGLSAIARGTVPSVETLSFAASRFDDISASTEEMLLLYEMAQGLSGNLDIADVAESISKHLRRLVPATTLCVFHLRQRTGRANCSSCLWRKRLALQRDSDRHGSAPVRVGCGQSSNDPELRPDA